MIKRRTQASRAQIEFSRSLNMQATNWTKFRYLFFFTIQLCKHDEKFYIFNALRCESWPCQSAGVMACRCCPSLGVVQKAIKVSSSPPRQLSYCSGNELQIALSSCVGGGGGGGAVINDKWLARVVVTPAEAKSWPRAVSCRGDIFIKSLSARLARWIQWELRCHTTPGKPESTRPGRARQTERKRLFSIIYIITDRTGQTLRPPSLITKLTKYFE